MYVSKDKITEIFVLVDEFCIEFDRTISNIVWEISQRKSLK